MGTVSTEVTQDIMHVIDWTLDPVAFEREIRRFLRRARDAGKVLALPIDAQRGMAGVDQIALLLASVRCEGCAAPCCKRGPGNKGISLTPAEYRRLSKMRHLDIVVQDDDFVEMSYPCAFLKDDRCSIYEVRPLICTLYPWQHGGRDLEHGATMALASDCPEAEKVARRVYLAQYYLRRKFKEVQHDPEVQVRRLSMAGGHDVRGQEGLEMREKTFRPGA